jgi:hypothetical protein
MIPQYYQLDHKNPRNDGKQMELFEFYSHDDRYGHYKIPEKYRTQGQPEHFALCLTDFVRYHFTHQNEVDDTENGSQDQPLPDSTLVAGNKKQSRKNGHHYRSGAVFFLGLTDRFHFSVISRLFRLL